MPMSGPILAPTFLADVDVRPTLSGTDPACGTGLHPRNPFPTRKPRARPEPMHQRQISPTAIHRGPTLEPGDDAVVVEGPLQVALGGEPVAVTMRTPGEDEALARGMLVAEGLIVRDAEVAATWRPCDRFSDAAVIDLLVAPEDLLAAPRPRGQIASASCGLCGTRSLTDISLPDPVVDDGWRLDPARIPAFMAAMEGAQAGFRRTGGSHAAALLDAEGAALGAAEDVGRHNAVDKAAGLALERGWLTAARCLVVSGRVSFEIAAKAARLGVPVIAAVSAPSSLAIELAERCGLGLLGFCRGDRFTCYAGAWRLEASGG